MWLLKSVITWQDVYNSDIILIIHALGISAITVVFSDYSYLFIKINANIMYQLYIMYGIINYTFNMLNIIPPLLTTSAYQSHSQILDLRYRYLGVKHVCTPVAPVNIVLVYNSLALILPRRNSKHLGTLKLSTDSTVPRGGAYRLGIIRRL